MQTISLSSRAKDDLTKPQTSRSTAWARAFPFARSALLIGGSFLLGCLPWYAGQFPASGTNDSLDQLRQAAGIAPLNDAHSIALTLALRLFHENAPLVVFLQHLLLAMTIGLTFSLASNGFRWHEPNPRWIAPAIIAFCAGLWPNVGAWPSELIVDVPFAVLILLGFTVWAIVLLHHRRSFQSWLLLGVLSCAPWLVRHEALGFIPLAFAGALWVLPKSKAIYRPLSGFVVGLVLVAALRSLLPVMFKAAPSYYGFAYSVAFVHDISGILAEGGRVDDVDRAFIENFAQPDYLKNIYQPDTICCHDFSRPPQSVNTPWLANHKLEFASGWWRLAKKNLGLLGTIRLVRLGHDFGIFRQWLLPYLPHLKNNPFGLEPYPTAYAVASRDFLDWTAGPVWRAFFWSSIWALAALLVTMTLALRRGESVIAALALVPVLHVLGLSLVQHAGVGRYHFYLAPTAILLGLSLWGRGRAPASDHAAVVAPT